jgi:putative isomerase
MEKMYSLRASGNPSNWLGPVWGISNYMVWRGLVKYGFEQDARELAAKTIVLFGRDFQHAGALHEYYDPETGEPILNKGFQDWNYLVLNMCAWMEGKPVIEEF